MPKRSIGVTVVSCILIIFSLLAFSIIPLSFAQYGFHKKLIFPLSIAFIYGLLLITPGIGLLMLKPFARKLALFVTIIGMISCLFRIIGQFLIAPIPVLIIAGITALIAYVSIFFYLTRPKIKEQFRPTLEKKG